MKQAFLLYLTHLISCVVSVTVIVTRTVYLPITQMIDSDYNTNHVTSRISSGKDISKLIQNDTSIVKIPKLKYNFEEGHLVLGSSGDSECDGQTGNDTDTDNEIDYETDNDTDYDTEGEMNQDILEISNSTSWYHNKTSTNTMSSLFFLNNTTHPITSIFWSKSIMTSSSTTLKIPSQNGEIIAHSSFTWSKPIVLSNDDQQHFPSYRKSPFSPSIVSTNFNSQLNLSHNTKAQYYDTFNKSGKQGQVSTISAGEKSYTQIKTIEPGTRGTTPATNSGGEGNNVKSSEVSNFNSSPQPYSVVYSTDTSLIKVQSKSHTILPVSNVPVSTFLETSIQLYNSSQQVNNDSSHSTFTNKLSKKSIINKTKTERKTRNKESRLSMARTVTTDQSIFKSIVSFEFTKSFSLLRHNNTILINDQLSRSKFLNSSPIIFLIFLIFL